MCTVNITVIYTIHDYKRRTMYYVDYAILANVNIKVHKHAQVQ